MLCLQNHIPPKIQACTYFKLFLPDKAALVKSTTSQVKNISATKGHTSSVMPSDISN
uniref:Uncharacterized protein n=1 Tax=Anguilla anguilla TaxID=7936 RepID=A0A0E9VBD2_ANGAN